MRDFFLHLGRLRRASAASQPFWALKNVSFTIHAGETVGLIGPNGAGKSTALKLISGVSRASSGQVNVKGRVGALLELGAGFHPELSGRDNIYLNAALLGMSRREIQRKFEAIVDFSELEAFIDTPVKHYSSGMFMRLAFAVNIHVEPEILLVDEVLAVGDIDFQWKCIERINELRKQNVTILLVSHSLDLVRDICRRTIWFDKGQVQEDGLTGTVINHYQAAVLQHTAEQLLHTSDKQTLRSQRRWGNQKMRITRVRLLDGLNAEQTIFQTGQPFRVRIDYWADDLIPSPIFGLAIFRQDGLQICGPNTAFSRFKLPDMVGAGSVEYNVPKLPLLEGLYRISAAIVDATYTETFDYQDEVHSFRVSNHTQDIVERYGLMTLSGEWAYHLNEPVNE